MGIVYSKIGLNKEVTDIDNVIRETFTGKVERSGVLWVRKFCSCTCFLIVTKD